MISYQFRQSLQRRTRYPFVLMLEPLYTCNLACIGCSVERHTGKLANRVPLADCLKAVDDCGAPSVSICGGEPTLYPELEALVSGIIERKRHIHLCTNGLVLEDKVFDVIAPHKRLTINVHLDGLRATHDRVCARAGVFDKAIANIQRAKALGYHVMTNTTIYRDTELPEIEALCELVTNLGVDGMLLAPGYHYESVEADIFLTRSEIQRKFRHVIELAKRYPIASTPLYLEFAAGQRDYACSPWSTITFTPRGWKGPCYLIGQEYWPSYQDLWQRTDWGYWESRCDERCQNCAMHSGFEASAVQDMRKHPKDLLRVAAWNLTR
jgi:hopanoid biosynthesis associated radical SAM protein HpnH